MQRNEIDRGRSDVSVAAGAATDFLLVIPVHRNENALDALLPDHHYDPADYLRDYDEFLRLAVPAAAS